MLTGGLKRVFKRSGEFVVLILGRKFFEGARKCVDWATHGRAAGPIRNQAMLQEGKPDVVVAFERPHAEPRALPASGFGQPGFETVGGLSLFLPTRAHYFPESQPRDLRAHLPG